MVTDQSQQFVCPGLSATMPEDYDAVVVQEFAETRPADVGTDMGDLSLEVILFLVLAALVAGFVDAVVGGGGLVQLPALLVGLPGASVVQIAATNKLASFCGTSISAATYVRRIRPDPRTFLPLMLAGVLRLGRRSARGLAAAAQRLRPDHPGRCSCWSAPTSGSRRASAS